MKVEFVLFAEAVNRGVNETLNILGEFNTLYSPTFPVVRPITAGVIRVSGKEGDAKSYKLRAELVSPTGKRKLWQLPEVTMTRDPKKKDQPMRGDIVFNAFGIVFPEEGEYLFRIYLDNRLTHSKTLYVFHPPASSK